MAEDRGRVYTLAITATDMLLSVIILFLVFWRGVVHPVLFVMAVASPLVGLGYYRGMPGVRGLNILIGITLLSYFLAVNYYLVMLPSAEIYIGDMVSIVIGTVFSILLVVLSLICAPKKIT